MKKYQICTNCVMDTSDPDIVFDDNGVCSNCREFNKRTKPYLNRRNKEQELREIVRKIKRNGKNKKYDCILGISGGIDSAYLAYLAHSLQLRVLAVHVDAGWNSEIAVNNIEKMCKKLGYDLHTIVIDWPTMKELQRAFMFSGVSNLDIPQDHVFIAATYHLARKYKIRYILSGGNLATEGIFPHGWEHSALDYTFIKDVYRKNKRNNMSLKRYPHINTVDYIVYTYLGLFKFVRLLDYIDYSKAEAIATLEKEFDWQYYGGKHFESRFTKFFQSYYTPRKFNYDKRRAHLSSLIVNGEISREDALKEMENPNAYPEEEMIADRDYILRKLNISLEEWNNIMDAPCKTTKDYRNNEKQRERLRKIKHLFMK